MFKEKSLFNKIWYKLFKKKLIYKNGVLWNRDEKVQYQCTGCKKQHWNIPDMSGEKYQWSWDDKISCQLQPIVDDENLKAYGFINTEVKNYLNKATKHLFLINGVEHKILVEGDFIIRITGKDVSVSEIYKKIGWYGSNSKCVIKHDLFLIPRYYNKDITTIKYYKDARKLYDKISESIKGKENANEIRNIVLGLL